MTDEEHQTAEDHITVGENLDNDDDLPGPILPTARLHNPVPQITNYNCDCMLRVSRPDFRTQTGPHVVTLANIQQCLRVINRSLDQIPSNTDMFQSFEGMRNVLQELVTHFRIINDSFEESLQNALFTTQSVPFVYYVKMLCDVPRIGLSLGNAARYVREMALMLDGEENIQDWNDMFGQNPRQNCQTLLNLLTERLNLARCITRILGL
ncbi:uncharacterized protein LOC142341869 isoform X2 [Convolutriloba macropyga]|uniref:uncharacterized protein LOC142341869 isoform X2 n=1 Tax=Convolutriloba macropyga TaxID=536237 RepID=UPI003F520D98